jgi:hypothetical protein
MQLIVVSVVEMAANETQESNIVIKIDRVVHAKLNSRLSSECSLKLENSLANLITKEILSHM